MLQLKPSASVGSWMGWSYAKMKYRTSLSYRTYTTKRLSSRASFVVNFSPYVTFPCTNWTHYCPMVDIDIIFSSIDRSSDQAKITTFLKDIIYDSITNYYSWHKNDSHKLLLYPSSIMAAHFRKDLAKRNVVRSAKLNATQLVFTVYTVVKKVF